MPRSLEPGTRVEALARHAVRSKVRSFAASRISFEKSVWAREESEDDVLPSKLPSLCASIDLWRADALRALDGLLRALLLDDRVFGIDRANGVRPGGRARWIPPCQVSPSCV